MNNPTNINLKQMHEGYVAIDCTIPSNATHLKLYLSITPGVLGNLYATVRTDSAGGLFFNGPKGWFGYVTVRAFNIQSSDESINTDQHILQMFERVLEKYNIIHFFHDKNTDLQWAIGYRLTDNAVFLIKSADYFTNWNVVSYWLAGEIDNGGILAFYIDKFGLMYIGNRPGALISRDNGFSWQQLPWQFQTPSQSIITPFWNITEDETSNLIVFSEYGSAPNGPHHRIVWSTDPLRNSWSQQDLNWGQYRHIHGYHINPYKPNIHFLFLGDPYIGQPSDGTPGFYVSQDSGATWSGEVLNQGGNTVNFGGDGVFRNAPCMVTWWPSGKALISNDTAQRGKAAWYGNGPINWGYYGLNPQINLLGHIDNFSTWPATPWSAIAVENGYETYCVSNHDGAAFNGDPNIPGANIAYTPPSTLWRYDANQATNPDNDGNTGVVTMMMKVYWPAVPFLYISAGRGNTFPSNAEYIFCNAWGGIRIPRKVRVPKKSVLVVHELEPNNDTQVH